MSAPGRLIDQCLVDATASTLDRHLAVDGYLAQASVIRCLTVARYSIGVRGLQLLILKGCDLMAARRLEAAVFGCMV